MITLKSILAASAILAGAFAAYAASAHDWPWFVGGALCFGAIVLPLAYDRLIMKVVLKDGSQVTLDASRDEK